MPAALALIRNMFHDPAQRTMAISVSITSILAGAAVGPVIGGALLEFFWWGSVFLIGIPVMVLLLAAGPCCCPSTATRTLAGWTCPARRWHWPRCSG